MTAAFDATRGTDQRFTDALSGFDGTADPSITMPVLDIYPDALSASMPVDLVPVIIPLPSAGGPTGVRAEPVRGPAAVAGRVPAAQRGQARPPAPRKGAPRQAAPRQQPPQRPAPRPANPRPAAPQLAAPIPHIPARQLMYQGKTVTAADVAAMFRTIRPGRPMQVDRQSFQATHPQSMGSTSPDAVAPAAPMASQYSPRGAVRNTNRNTAQERRRSSSTPKRTSSAWAVIVFIVVILFATGIGRQIIDAITELLNR